MKTSNHKRYNNIKGAIAEWLVMFYLLAKGYRPKKWRYSTPFAEIDWLCHKNNVLVVVEVKFRSRWNFDPIITPQQEARLRRALQFCMKRFGYDMGQLDGVVLSLNHRPVHYKNMW
ncbi:MAG: YraN family protein [Alphaproteobacteria bacterium]